MDKKYIHLRLPKRDFSGTIASLSQIETKGLKYEKNMESKKTQKSKKTWLHEENGYNWWQKRS